MRVTWWGGDKESSSYEGYIRHNCEKDPELNIPGGSSNDFLRVFVTSWSLLLGFKSFEDSFALCSNSLFDFFLLIGASMRISSSVAGSTSFDAFLGLTVAGLKNGDILLLCFVELDILRLGHSKHWTRRPADRLESLWYDKPACPTCRSSSSLFINAGKVELNGGCTGSRW